MLDDIKLGYITMINGPVIRASGLSYFAMGELVKVGEMELMGEILHMDGDNGTIQVYEDTTGSDILPPPKRWGLLGTYQLTPI